MATNLPYRRSSRLAKEIYEVISELCYNQLSDPRLRGIQLTSAEMTDDLQLLKLYYYLDGSEDKRDKCAEGLESAKGFFKRAISDKIKLRIVPDIKFHFDKGVESAEKLDKIFESLKREGQQ